MVVNAGNANVFTGARGRETTQATADAAAALLGCRPDEVFLASTGVIGEVLPHERITTALPALHASLSADRLGGGRARHHDHGHLPQGATRTAEIGGTPVRITGIAKGSGMIAPDMATMLCFVFTDASVPAAACRACWPAAPAQLQLHHGRQRHLHQRHRPAVRHRRRPATAQRRDLAAFAAALDAVLLDLALQVVRDGEGAQKLIRIDVTGAVDDGSAKRVAMAVANSPLVKTAIAGEDANWGRIVMAVGKAGEPADRDRLSVGVGGTWMARDGTVVPGYDEAPVVAHMKGREIEIAVDLGPGHGRSHRMDLRPDARLHRHQRLLPQLRRASPSPACGRGLG